MPFTTLFQLYHGNNSLIHDPLVKQTITRLGNVPCPFKFWTLHHKRCATTWDQTRDAMFQILDANRSATADCIFKWMGSIRDDLSCGVLRSNIYIQKSISMRFCLRWNLRILLLNYNSQSKTMIAYRLTHQNLVDFKFKTCPYFK